jgi:hypothetical protein
MKRCEQPDDHPPSGDWQWALFTTELFFLNTHPAIALLLQTKGQPSFDKAVTRLSKLFFRLVLPSNRGLDFRSRWARFLLFD